MDRSAFLRDDSWHGSFLELSIELGPTGNDARAAQALQALWTHPALRGPWSRRSDFSTPPVEPKLDATSLMGCLQVADGIEVGCLSFLVREDAGDDWLDLSIPTGMLELMFSVSYPLDTATNPWLSSVENLLAAIGARVFTVVPFRLGLLGEEASGSCSASQLTVAHCERGGVLVPMSRWEELQPARTPEELTPGLAYAPHWGPHITYAG